MKTAQSAPELGPMFSSYQINVPQLNVDLDRVKAKQQGVAVTDVFNTMQIYLGSQYVNDFNRFGRVYQVRAQADAPFRANPEDILQLKTRNSAGQMVPLSSLVNVTQTYGPEMVVRYNGYTSADINGTLPQVIHLAKQKLRLNVLLHKLYRVVSSLNGQI